MGMISLSLPKFLWNAHRPSSERANSNVLLVALLINHSDLVTSRVEIRSESENISTTRSNVTRITRKTKKMTDFLHLLYFLSTIPKIPPIISLT